MTARRWLDGALVIALFVLGWALSWAAGVRGWMPLDQSIVFDGGWRLLSGQVPFRDFGTPAGFVPMLMQALVFGGFGVKWSSYVVHAAAVNGAYCVVAYGLLRAFALGRGRAAVFAAGSAWLLYPPVGTPYPEQHAFFFVVLAIAMAAWLGDVRSERAYRVGWAAVGVVWWLAVLSKPNAAGFGALPLGIIILVPPRGTPGRGWAARLAGVAAGVLVAVLATALAAGVAGVDPAMFALYGWHLPAGAGLRRVGVEGLLQSVERLSAAGLVSLAVVPVLAVGALVRVALARGRPEALSRLAGVTSTALLALSLTVWCVLFLATTVNQAAVAVAPAFIALGLGTEAAARCLPGRWLPRGLAAVVMALVLFDVIRFHTLIVETRSVLDIEYRPEAATRMRTPGLEAMWHQAPKKTPVSANDLADVLQFLADRPGDFLLIGDHSILYGLSGRPSLSPSLWFHAGLAHPAADHPARGAYEAALAGALKSGPHSGGARWVIVEGERTWMGTRLSKFPSVASRIIRPPKRIGAFRIYRVRDEARQ